MSIDRLPRWGALLLSISMILGGIFLLVRAIDLLPVRAEAPIAAAPATRTSLESTIGPTPESIQPESPRNPAITAASSGETETPLPGPSPTPTPVPPVSVSMAAGVPEQLQAALKQAGNVEILDSRAGDVPPHPISLQLDPGSEGSTPIYQQFFAAGTRFDTLLQDLAFADIQALWSGEPPEAFPFQSIIVMTTTLPALESLLGSGGGTVQPVDGVESLREQVWRDSTALALVPFDLLTPELAPLAVDGQNPVENETGFDSTVYPLRVQVYLTDTAGTPQSAAVGRLLAEQVGNSNRDPAKLTLLIMTGVTAMVRETAYKMDTFGPEWVAEDIGPILRAADITHVSNEVPFVPGCETNRDPNNLIFCSSPDYMAALEAIGTDIIGLTGNHQNDYGPEDALKSLNIYAEAKLPVYGGGRNKTEAFAPLYLEHNGTRFAFLGANSYGPPFAWARDDAPGSAQFDLNILSATIRSIREKDLADVILVELQYQETYDVTPLWIQRQDFRALIQAGADVVTGVQSHVAQAIEFEQGRPILYGLGNLFFDQMWSDSTRDALIVKHTFYDGRHIATRLLPTILHDFGQPRWATGEDRERILRHVFAASYWERPAQ